MTRKTHVIDAMEKQIAEILVDQVRDDLLRSCGKEPEPDSNRDGESTGRSLKRWSLQCERHGSNLGGPRNGGLSSRILLRGWNSP
jgi:hypothetical protein